MWGFISNIRYSKRPTICHLKHVSFEKEPKAKIVFISLDLWPNTFLLLWSFLSVSCDHCLCPEGLGMTRGPVGQPSWHLFAWSLPEGNSLSKKGCRKTLGWCGRGVDVVNRHGGWDSNLVCFRETHGYLGSRFRDWNTLGRKHPYLGTLLRCS